MLMPSIFRENLFDDMMDFPFGDEFFKRHRALPGGGAADLMKTDVKEVDGAYEIDIDLPGFKKDNISAKLENGYLTIQAAKTEEKEEKGRYIRKERYVGQCSRSFYVGTAVKQEDIQARFEDGILRLRVPAADAGQIGEQKYIAIEG